jgi:hypothetical protein
MVYHYSWKMCLFINNTCGLCVMGHHVIFSALSNSIWTQTFGGLWIERGGPVNWPAQSPDRNSLDIWLLRHLGTLVYSEPINDLALEILQQWIQNTCQEIRVKPLIFDEYAFLCMWTAQSICCRDNTNKNRVLAGVSVWTSVEWDLFAHFSRCYTPLKSFFIYTRYIKIATPYFSENCLNALVTNQLSCGVRLPATGLISRFFTFISPADSAAKL